MQTRVPAAVATSEQGRIDRPDMASPAQRSAGVVDKRPQTARLHVLQAMMHASRRQQQGQAAALPAVAQLRPIPGIYGGTFDSETLSRDQILDLYQQLIASPGDGATLRALEEAIAAKEFQGGPIQVEDVLAGTASHRIQVLGYTYKISELTVQSREFYYQQSEKWLNAILAGIENLHDPRRPVYQSRIGELRSKVNEAYNAWHVQSLIGKADRFKSATGTTLHHLVYRVVAGAMKDQASISGMSYDRKFRYNPETQLAFCLEQCKDSGEDVLATSLYTSYFYEPLNRYFRGQLTPDGGTAYGQLIVKTAQILRQAYASQPAKAITGTRYRLELKSGWIADSVDELEFKALTSTHPNIDGVKNMWSDVADKLFGDYDNFALLAFNGTAKMLRPDLKYFPGETEDLMEPGAKYRVVKRYAVEGAIPRIGPTRIRVFHLSNDASDDGSRVQPLSFGQIV